MISCLLRKRVPPRSIRTVPVNALKSQKVSRQNTAHLGLRITADGEINNRFFLSLHRAFCSLFNYTHKHMHIYIYIYIYYLRNLKFTLQIRIFIGPCIIVIVEELETNLMSLVMFITLNICSTCFEH